MIEQIKVKYQWLFNITFSAAKWYSIFLKKLFIFSETPILSISISDSSISVYLGLSFWIILTSLCSDYKIDGV